MDKCFPSNARDPEFEYETLSPHKIIIIIKLRVKLSMNLLS